MWSFALVAQDRVDSRTLDTIGERLCPYGNAAGAIEIAPGIHLVANSRGNRGNQAICEDGDYVVIVVGDVQNERTLRELMVVDDAQAATAGLAELVTSLLARHGESSAAWLEGGFVVVRCNRRRSTMRVFASPTAQLPLYVVPANGVILTTELKSLVGTVPLTLKPFAAVGPFDEVSSDYTAFANVVKVRPGVWAECTASAEVRYDGSPELVLRDTARAWSSQTSGRVMGQLIESSVRECVEGGPAPLRSCLSSGFDSALIVALVSKWGHRLSACSIGSSTRNEFSGASETAHVLGVSHDRYLVDHQDWMTGILDAVYYGEFWDGYAAEFQAPLALLYRRLEGSTGLLLSGYGADLLSGGMLDPTSLTSEINVKCALSIRRAMATQETSPFLGGRWGIRVRCPFWTGRLMRVAMCIPGEHKISGGVVKRFLRDWSEEAGVLPHTVARRPKLAVNEGSGVDSHFAEFIRATTSRDYLRKSAFVYRALSKMFVDGVPRKELNPIALRDEL